MDIAGVIAEFNPIHNGHQYLLQQCRAHGCDAVVCAMSGNFVQRGEGAIFNKFARSAMAIRAGADLVLEIPTPWAMASAEVFASGGVEILTKAQCTHLVFGSESGKLEELLSLKDVLCSEQVQKEIGYYLEQGISYPNAVEKAVAQQYPQGVESFRAPNNILALEYLKAIDAQHSPMRPISIARQGAGHDSQEEGQFVSASFLRGKLQQGQSLEGYVPEEVLPIVLEEIKAGRGPVEIPERSILFALRNMTEEDLEVFADSHEGLHHRFYDAIHQASCVEELLQMVKTKRYPMARIRRMMMASYLQMEKAEGSIPYIRVLAFNKKGQSIIKQMKLAGIDILTKAADVDKLGERARHYFEQEARFTDIFSLGYPNLSHSKPGDDWRFSPTI